MINVTVDNKVRFLTKVTRIKTEPILKEIKGKEDIAYSITYRYNNKGQMTNQITYTNTLDMIG